VQGVGFRYSAIREARRLGIRGLVRNTEDGSVEVIAEGDAESLRIFAAWLRRGPPGAHVRELELTPIPPTGSYREFDVDF
jgi:acylphosphatase